MVYTLATGEVRASTSFHNPPFYLTRYAYYGLNINLVHRMSVGKMDSDIYFVRLMNLKVANPGEHH